MTRIVYTDQTAFKGPVIEVKDGLSETEITSIVGHDDWDYVIEGSVLAAQTELCKALAAVISAIALLPLLILPASAKWQSQWPTAWAEINNTRYLIPYFPGKRLVGDTCYFLTLDGSLRSDGPSNQAGECPEG